MGRLVYHDLSGISGQFSPFDKAVLEVAKSGAVSIVSPYIGVDYLQRIIQASNEWRLISDIEAWLSSLSIRARPKAWLFIRENLESIHHCPAIHAKAVISQKLAMFGSANLTNTGILSRTEMGILIDEPMMVLELGVWFNTLWHQTLPPIADETNAFVQWLDEESDRIPARREKFSLSASSKKIRARLVKLHAPLRPEPEDAPLNLDSIAQTLVLQEQHHYDSLEEAIEVAINTLARDKFTFNQVVVSVHRGFPSASIREIYFALLQHCANHVRSVFAENTRNRLILSDGTFIQSARELITQALEPFDIFLANLIHHFDFIQHRDLPNEERIENKTSFRGNDQVILISELLDCGLLELEDVAGHLPRYRLSEDFEWNGRYRLFAKSMHDWFAKRSAPASKIEVSKLNNEDDDDFLSEKRDADQIPDKVLKAAYAQVEFERRKKVDKVLAQILAHLFSGEHLQVTKSLPINLAQETGVGVRIVQMVISGIGEATPKVILLTHASGLGRIVSIHPNLDWKDLADYPLTQNTCKNFLGT